MPDTLQNYLARSDQLIAREDWAGQASLIGEAVASYPAEPELWIRYALVTGKAAPDEAARYANRAAELADTDPGMLARCAVILFDLEYLDDARRYLRRIASLAPDDFPLLPDMLHLAGKLAAHGGKSEVAERYLRKALEIDPSADGHARVLAQFLLSRNRRDDALDVIAQGLEHRAPDEQALIALRDSLG